MEKICRESCTSARQSWLQTHTCAFSLLEYWPSSELIVGGCILSLSRLPGTVRGASPTLHTGHEGCSFCRQATLPVSPPPPSLLPSFLVTWCSCGGDDKRWIAEERCDVQLLHQCLPPPTHHLLHHAPAQVDTQTFSFTLPLYIPLSVLSQSHAQTPPENSDLCSQHLIGAAGQLNRKTSLSNLAELLSVSDRLTTASTSPDQLQRPVMWASLTPSLTTAMNLL